MGRSFRRSALPAGVIYWGRLRLVIPSDDRLDVVVCDVSGHGISSALVANRIYSETMAQIERGAELGSMLRHLNHFAVQNLASSNFFFTVAAVRLYHARGRLQFAGAGHPPAILIHRGQSPRLLESTNMVLGLFEDAVDNESSVETVLQRGDRVVIYTDGLTENFNSQREMLGVDGLKEILTEASTLPLDEMKSQRFSIESLPGATVQPRMMFPSCCWKFPDFSSRLQTRPNPATIMRDEITRLWTNLTRLLARNIYLSSDLPPNKKLRIWAHNFRVARHPSTI